MRGLSGSGKRRNPRVIIINFFCFCFGLLEIFLGGISHFLPLSTTLLQFYTTCFHMSSAKFCKKNASIKTKNQLFCKADSCLWINGNLFIYFFLVLVIFGSLPYIGSTKENFLFFPSSRKRIFFIFPAPVSSFFKPTTGILNAQESVFAHTIPALNEENPPGPDTTAMPFTSLTEREFFENTL